MKPSPTYYNPIKPSPRVPAAVTPMDIAIAYQLSPPFQAALKYILRHGEKPGTSAAGDAAKAIGCLEFALDD